MNNPNASEYAALLPVDISFGFWRLPSGHHMAHWSVITTAARPIVERLYCAPYWNERGGYRYFAPWWRFPKI